MFKEQYLGVLEGLIPRPYTDTEISQQNMSLRHFCWNFQMSESLSFH